MLDLGNNTSAPMTLTPLLPTTSVSHHHKPKKKKKKKKNPNPVKAPTLSSWEQFKSLLSCRSSAARVHDPAAAPRLCGSSICALRDVAQGNTRVIHRKDTDTMSLSDHLASSTRYPQATVRGGMQLRRLSGCYECQAVNVQPLSRYPRPRTLSPCSECGEVFTKPESLELHQTLRHAVSEMGPEESSRNIVEIIFKSSWQKQDRPICMVDRILKVHNSHRTIASFESYRDAVKSRAASAASGSISRHHRCAADGNELLRFHCTSLSCSLGAHGSTALCLSATDAAVPCSVCTVLRYGFARAQQRQAMNGVRTTASSGRAHECGPPVASEGRRAMLVCRVIAGRVRRAYQAVVEENSDGYDSVAGGETNLEELFVASPRAILPCFVVIYKALDD